MVVELFSPSVGNQEYQCKLSEYQGSTLLSTSKRYKKQPSSSLGTHRFLDLLATDPPGAEHSRIWAQGSNTGDIHPEGLDLLART